MLARDKLKNKPMSKKQVEKNNFAPVLNEKQTKSSSLDLEILYSAKHNNLKEKTHTKNEHYFLRNCKSVEHVVFFLITRTCV